MAKRGIVVRTVAFDKGIVITASKGGDEIYGSTTAWLAAYVPLVRVNLYIPLFKYGIQSTHCSNQIQRSWRIYMLNWC